MKENLPAVSGSEMVAVSQSREVSEVQAMVVMAKNYPRNVEIARQKMLTMCKNRSVALTALYTYPKGNTEVKGASIRLAEIMAQSWGNLDFGQRVLHADDEKSVMEAFCWDLETNVRRRRIFEIKHERSTKKGSYKLTDQRDVYEHTANMGARRERACILGIIPKYLQDECENLCENTISKVEGKTVEETSKYVLGRFETIGVNKVELESYLGHELKGNLKAGDIAALTRVFNSINDGYGKKEDFFKPADTIEGESKYATTPAKEKAQAEKDSSRNRLKEIQEIFMTVISERMRHGVTRETIDEAVGGNATDVLNRPVDAIEAAIEAVRDIEITGGLGDRE